ncbi:MAG: nuclear transport factor 2 family protein [Bradyrhizobium guangdongense]
MDDIDQMGIVVDWLDACRKGDLDTLLDLYADDAELECQCDGAHVYHGRSEIETYWGPKLVVFPATGVGLEDISPAPQGISLEYSVAGSLRIRALFGFAANGKIVRTLCEPAQQNPADCCSC